MAFDLRFSDDQELFRRTCREFTEKELAPAYASRDKSGELPSDVGLKMGALGLTGLRIPEEYGGTEADFVTCGIASEECSRGDINTAYLILIGALCSDTIAHHGTEELKRAWLPKMASGEAVVALALTEPHCGSDAAALTTRAVRDGDEYVITGEKSSITFTAGAAGIVFAKTDPAAGAKGISAFFVPFDSPGVGRSYFSDLGGRAVTRGAIHLDGVRVPASHLIGHEGAGFYMVMNEFDYSRALIALMCTGLTQQTVDETIVYVKSRQAFGQPLARFQGVSFPIVEAAAQLEAVRLFSYKALWLRDNGLPHAKEAAMVKWMAPLLAERTIHKMLLLHGHSAYGDDYPIAQRLRDVIALEIGDGTAEVMKMVAAREMIGREYRCY